MSEKRTYSSGAEKRKKMRNKQQDKTMFARLITEFYNKYSLAK